MEKDVSKLQLILVTNRGSHCFDNYLEFIEHCVKSGVTAIQLREKQLSYDELLLFGKTLKSILDPLHIPLIINDHVKLCLDLDGSGVHLGQSDLDVMKARSMLSSQKIIGLSVNSIEQLKQANTLPLDYVGIGAIFPTENKPNIETIWGLDKLKKAAAISKHPIVAIGGITEHNARDVIRSGSHGIAAIGAFHDTLDPYRTTQNLSHIIREVYDDRQHRKSNNAVKAN